MKLLHDEKIVNWEVLCIYTVVKLQVAQMLPESLSSAAPQKRHLASRVGAAAETRDAYCGQQLSSSCTSDEMSQCPLNP